MEYNRNTLKMWMEQVRDLRHCAHLDTDESVAIVYMGFKIELFEMTGYIYDVRSRDVYTPVSKKNLAMMEHLGFPLACKKIMYLSDIKRKERQRRLYTSLSTKQHSLLKEGTPGALRKYNGIESRRKYELSLYFFYAKRCERLKAELKTKGLIN